MMSLTEWIKLDAKVSDTAFWECRESRGSAEVTLTGGDEGCNRDCKK